MAGLYGSNPPIARAPPRAPRPGPAPAPRASPRSPMPDYRLCPIYVQIYAPIYTRRYRMTWKCIETRSSEGIERPCPPFAQDTDRFAQLGPRPAPAPAHRPGPPGRTAPPPRRVAPAGKSPADHPRRPSSPALPLPKRQGRPAGSARPPDAPPPAARPASICPHDLGGHERGEDMT